MDVGETIRSAVRQTPAHPLARTEADWEPWLVLADWLSERGDPRGRWIVLAHGVETRTGSLDQRRQWREELRDFEREGPERWLGDHEVPHTLQLRWAHGFVMAAHLSGIAPREEVGLLSRLLAEPVGLLLSRVVVRSNADVLARLARLGGLERITHLELEMNHSLTPPMVESLARCAGWAGVKRLGMRSWWRQSRPPPDVLRPLVASALCDGLEALSVRTLDFGVETVRPVLADASALEELDLAYLRMGEEGVAEVVAAAPPGLRSLSLHDETVGDRGAEHVAGLSGLTGLDLVGCRIEDAGARALAEAASLASLHRLRLSRNGIGRTGARALARSLGGASVECLELSRNPVGSPGVEALIASEAHRGLRRLTLRQSGLDDRAVDVIVGASWPLLEHLELRDNALGEDALERLTSAPSLARADVMLDRR